MGIPATKKSVEVRGMVMSRLKDNRISEDWEILDNLLFINSMEPFPNSLEALSDRWKSSMTNGFTLRDPGGYYVVFSDTSETRQ